MSENLQWIFSGIGVEILKIIVTLIVGGYVGYKFGIRKNIRQTQKANNNANQKQEVDIKNVKDDNKESMEENYINQVQRAGDGVTQSQIGRIE